MLMHKTIMAIFQARIGSQRRPGKTMADICGKPLLEHIIERVKHCKLIEGIIVATTEKPQDDIIVELCDKLGIKTFRGSEKDVLDRYYQCSKKFSVDIIVRITADDPFKEPAVIDRAIQIVLSDPSIDYVSNTLKPTYPEGIDIELFTFQALEKAWKEALRPSEREHVTPYIHNHPDIFSLYNFENDKDLSGLRWTLDMEADLQFTREVYKRLYKEGEIFLMKDILGLLEKKPHLKTMNAGIERMAGYKKSVLEETKNGAYK